MKIVIIGGGNAGVATATRIRRANENAEIVILEKSEEFAVAKCGFSYLISGIVDDPNELVALTPQQMQRTFNVKVKLNHHVIGINRNEKILNIENRQNETYDKLIIATGGKSYPATGSTGDGYIFAKRMGHKIIPLKPSLVPIEVNAAWIKDLQGLSLKNVTLKAYGDNKVIHEEFGEMIFTHFGISGPIVLSMSNYLHGNYKKIKLSIDLKPALDYEKLDNRMLRDFQLYNNKRLKNSLNDLLPQRLIPWVIEYSEIDPEKIVNQITKEERSKLVSVIKGFDMEFRGFRPIEEAIITSGGISTKEINPSTMESKLIPNLFFAGEVIDVDALTGGYNLQIAYSTGYLAGMNV